MMDEEISFLSPINVSSIRLLRLSLDVNPNGPSGPCTTRVTVGCPERTLASNDQDEHAWRESIRFVLAIDLFEGNDQDQNVYLTASVEVLTTVQGDFSVGSEDSIERSLLKEAMLTSYEFARNKIVSDVSLSPALNFTLPSANADALLEVALNDSPDGKSGQDEEM